MECPSQTSSGGDLPVGDPGADRRGFLAQSITLALGAVALAVPAVLGLVAFFNPLRQKSRAGRFIRVTSLEALPADGVPRKFPVIADRTDAWNRFPNEAIGAVFLRRTGENEVQALNHLCPHAGCAVRYGDQNEADQNKRNKFICPCHTAVFELTGQRIMPSDSPRDLDELVVTIENGDISVEI